MGTDSVLTILRHSLNTTSQFQVIAQIKEYMQFHNLA